MPSPCHIWTNLRIPKFATSLDLPDRNLAIATEGRHIQWIGASGELPAAVRDKADSIIDAENQWAVPGLIDCHTHLVFGGNRAGEFRQRLDGASYEQIARAGGGIVSTVAATREASEDELFQSAAARLVRLIGEGVTRVEIKSGYGLDHKNEEKMLRVARRLGDELPVTVHTSFLGAHALPPEFASNRKGYLDLLCNEILPDLVDKGLVDAVDGFCEAIAFTPAEIERVFELAVQLKVPVKLHAEQLSDCGGTALAARFKALSVDHLEFVNEADVAAMAAAGTVAVLLPAAFYALRETKLPPVNWFREHAVPIAIGSDINPGSAPIRSLQLAMNMACIQFGLDVETVLQGVTKNAAKALGCAEDCGSLDPGKLADFAFYAIDDPAELCYWIGSDAASSVIRNGELVDMTALQATYCG